MNTALAPAVVELEYRGTRFKFVEVDTSTYDSCLEKATTKSFETGVEEEKVDESLLIRLLLRASLVEPKFTAEDIGKLGVRLTRQLERDCRTLHFGNEPEEKAKKTRAKKDEEDEAPLPAEG